MALIDRTKFDLNGASEFLGWKCPSDSLTLGTQLIVNESQEAIFYKGGQALDLFGPGTHKLATGTRRRRLWRRHRGRGELIRVLLSRPSTLGFRDEEKDL